MTKLFARLLVVEIILYTALLFLIVQLTGPIVMQRIYKEGTKREMVMLSTAIRMYEKQEGAPPRNLSDLSPEYFKVTSGFLRDAGGIDYTYSPYHRKICSITYDYCITF